MKPGLYIHIPFCRQKCNYCDFASFAGLEDLIPAYLAALRLDAANAPAKQVETLYVGGGTPSLLSAAQLAQLCTLLQKEFGPISALPESTCEANPESLTPEKLTVLKNFGFTRLSLGLQSLDDKELKLLGRVHTRVDFLRAYQAARAAGFDNINIDLIAGLPGQTLEQFLANLQGVIALKPEHLSVYGLQIEEGTPFFERGIVCDQLLMRRMLEETHRQLIQAGFEHYEISNFALPGRQARHNTSYWRDGEYIGLGSEAASYWKGERRQNVSSVQEYIRRMQAGESPVCYAEHLTGKEKLGEQVMLGLRLLDGVELTDEIQQAFGKDIQTHIKNGLLTQENNKIKLTFEGLFLANEVFCSFVAPFEEE